MKAGPSKWSVNSCVDIGQKVWKVPAITYCRGPWISALRGYNFTVNTAAKHDISIFTNLLLWVDFTQPRLGKDRIILVSEWWSRTYLQGSRLSHDVIRLTAHSGLVYTWYGPSDCLPVSAIWWRAVACSIGSWHRVKWRQLITRSHPHRRTDPYPPVFKVSEAICHHEQVELVKQMG